jgi:hypothetical protein
MNTSESINNNAGEDVMKAVGELTATAEIAKNAITEMDIDHQEVKSWIKLILEAVLEIFKK